MLTVGIDVGGTFTDIVVVDSARERVTTAKYPSVAGQPSVAIVAALNALGLDRSSVGRVIHGTTIATNALLERKGAVTGFVTTKGCRDVIEVGRGRRLVEGGMFNVGFRRGECLVPRARRLEVDERLAATGEELAPLSEDDIVVTAKQLEGVQAVAVCFLHAYRFPEHEREAVRMLRKHLGPDVFITASNDVNPQVREFERFSTTVVNGYVGPTTVRYLRNLSEHCDILAQAKSTFVMGSAGGILDRETAATMPVRTILSGPAGGIVGARLAAEDVGIRDIVTCDMGGTSTDVALLRDGHVLYATETIVSGVPIRASQLEINTIGAGAGSIIAIDTDGALAVGPGSAGAFPGPACYGNGGVEPTVTDANVVLGRIADCTKLGGQISVQRALAEKAFANLIAQGHYLSAVAAAEGALEILVAKSAGAIREISLQRGFDPRDFALVAFGGAGPMHAIEIARALGIGTVIVPNHAGILSAVGLARAAIRRDAMEPFLQRLSTIDEGDFRSTLDNMANRLRVQMFKDGATPDSVVISFQVEARCVGQSHELLIELGAIGKYVGKDEIEARFRNTYAERYGRKPETAIEIVLLRATAEAFVDTAPSQVWTVSAERPRTSAKRTVWFDDSAADVPIIDRATLRANDTFKGPCIVEEMGATTVVPANWTGVVHASGHLVLKNVVH